MEGRSPTPCPEDPDTGTDKRAGSTPARRPRLTVANWKMYGLAEEARARVDALVEKDRKAGARDTEIVLCPPATLLWPVADRIRTSSIRLGAQDCAVDSEGARTGEVAAEMLRDAGCRYVLVGHSERRAFHGETDEQVREKALAAIRAGLVPIICIGENKTEREEGETLASVERQLRGSVPRTQAPMVIAYEPVWAIGTGKLPSPGQVRTVHEVITRWTRSEIGGEPCRALYGGSVTPDNARDMTTVPGVDGLLVGRASLQVEPFWAICRAVDSSGQVGS